MTKVKMQMQMQMCKRNPHDALKSSKRASCDVSNNSKEYNSKYEVYYEV